MEISPHATALDQILLKQQEIARLNKQRGELQSETDQLLDRLAKALGLKVSEKKVIRTHTGDYLLERKSQSEYSVTATDKIRA